MWQKSETVWIVHHWRICLKCWNLAFHDSSCLFDILLMSSSRCGFQQKGHSSEGVGGHATVQVSSCTKQLLTAKIFWPFSEGSCCSFPKTKVFIVWSRETTPTEVLFCDQGVIFLWQWCLYCGEGWPLYTFIPSVKPYDLFPSIVFQSKTFTRLLQAFAEVAQIFYEWICLNVCYTSIC